MDKKEAINRLLEIKGRNLHELAEEYEVTVATPRGTQNKGWAGHVCERHLGLALNSSRSPNMGSWELKSTSLKYLESGKLSVKETMAITMIDPVEVRQTEFEQSHMLAKLNKAVVVVRTVGKNFRDPSFVHSVIEIELDNDLYAAVKADYDLVRNILIKDPENGFSNLTGKMGCYIQPRTKGFGHGSISRAFYARPRFLRLFLSLDSSV